MRLPSALAILALSSAASAADSWPVLQAIAEGSAPILVDSAQPGYLQWSVDRRTEAPYFPAHAVATEVTRISDAAAFGLQGESFFKHAYAKVQPWNSDNTLMLVFRDGGTPGQTRGVLLDGRTFTWKKNLTYAGSSGRWSNAEPTKFFRMHWELPSFVVTDVLLDDLSTVRDFSALGYDRLGGEGLFAGEGRQSNDDRYWLFQLGKADGTFDLLTYDKRDDRVIGTIHLPSRAGGNYIDNWTMSQSGRFIVTQTFKAWTTRDGQAVPQGLNVWDRTGRYLRTGVVNLSHVDYGIDVAGNDVALFIGSKYRQNDKVGQTWRLDGTDGGRTTDQFIDMIGWNYHISTANTLKPGWAVITSFNHETPSDYDSFPMWNHLFAVRLDGAGEIAPIANLHHANARASRDAYDRSSMACPNRDLTAVVWGGTWGDADVDRPIHSYVARPVASAAPRPPSERSPTARPAGAAP